MVGRDSGDGRYHGTYTQGRDLLRVNVTLSASQGAMLATGQPMASGSSLLITADLPSNFANGQAQQIMVAGQPLQVSFEKVGEVP
jgi:hypothetical protein